MSPTQAPNRVTTLRTPPSRRLHRTWAFTRRHQPSQVESGVPTYLSDASKEGNGAHGRRRRLHRNGQDIRPACHAPPTQPAGVWPSSLSFTPPPPHHLAKEVTKPWSTPAPLGRGNAALLPPGMQTIAGVVTALSLADNHDTDSRGPGQAPEAQIRP